MTLVRASYTLFEYTRLFHSHCRDLVVDTLGTVISSPRFQDWEVGLVMCTWLRVVVVVQVCVI